MALLPQVSKMNKLPQTNRTSRLPQVKKPTILDFRCHKMAGGAQAAIGVFRKHIGNAKQSKYATIVRTAEDIENEEAGVSMVDEG